MLVVCPCCGAPEEPADGGSCALEDVGEFVCDDCGARFVFGKQTPRIVVDRIKDPADRIFWVRVRIQDPKTKEDIYVTDLDPKLAANVAKNLLSVVIP